MRVRLALGLLPLFFLPSSSAVNSPPRDLLATLNALHLDSEHVYVIAPADRIEIRRGDIALALDQGKLAFYQPFEGRITGFAFSGIGHSLAIPHDPTEKQQMVRFLGTPILDQQFVSIYARFTDDTAEELTAQLSHSSSPPAPDAAFGALWLSTIDRLNPTHSPRILVERYSSSPRHYFHAGIDGIQTGPFDLLVDQMRGEDFMLGQPRAVNKVLYYDVWTSYQLPNLAPPPITFDALHYQINTTIRPDNSIEGDAIVDFRALTGGESILFINLARTLKVDTVATASGETLPFFQNEGLTEQEARTRGDDTLCVFLPTAPRAGDRFALRFRYRGHVIENYGNSVLFVGERASWYPHYGDQSEFATYDLTFRWPKHLRLVATGLKSDEHEDGDFRTATWKSDRQIAEAGFNLGEYAVASISSANRTVEVYANKLLEQAIVSRLSENSIGREDFPHIPPSDPNTATTGFVTPAPSPADALKTLAREVDSSINFFEKYCGPFPFRNLAVSQIPGAFGQGWPGLLYLSTYSFLPQEAQERIGLSAVNQESFTDIVPVHEVAHQWWGNVVAWSSYRDQWIDEGLAVYLSLLFVDSQKSPNRTLLTWLARYRKHLLTKSQDDIAPADIGPVSIGSRLSSSKSPEAYDVVVYFKGAWIFHMLREMLRDPNAHDPDARFIALLHTLISKYAEKALTTDDFQHEVEAAMTRKMDLEGGRSMEWFFQQYVYGTGIPRYRVEFTTKRIEKGFQVRGKLYQDGVPKSFIAPVPLYTALAVGRSTYLGTVVTSGEVTPFSFNSATDPRKIQVDPHMTLLCVSE